MQVIQVDADDLFRLADRHIGRAAWPPTELSQDAIAKLISSAVGPAPIVIVGPNLGDDAALLALANTLASIGIQLNAVLTSQAALTLPPVDSSSSPIILASGLNGATLITCSPAGQQATPMLLEVDKRLLQQRATVRDLFQQAGINLSARDYRVTDAEIDDWLDRNVFVAAPAKSLVWTVGTHHFSIEHAKLRSRLNTIRDKLVQQIDDHLDASAQIVALDTVFIRRFGLDKLDRVGRPQFVPLPDFHAAVASWAMKTCSSNGVWLVDESVASARVLPLKSKDEAATATSGLGSNPGQRVAKLKWGVAAGLALAGIALGATIYLSSATDSPEANRQDFETRTTDHADAKEQNGLDEPRVLTVPQQFKTINDALKQAKAGDIVQIAPGTYRETLFLKSDVKVTGSADGRTIIEAEGNGVVVSASNVRNVTLHGVVVDGRGTAPIGIGIWSGSTATVTLCQARGATNYNISAYGTGAVATLSNNIVSDGGNGIAFLNGASGTASGNTCERNKWSGIVIDGTGTRAELTDNACRNSEYGIWFHNGASGTARGNSCEDNGVGIHFNRGASGTASGNTNERNKQSGIVVAGTDTRAELTDNTCRNNIYGIWFEDSAVGTASGNTCEGNKQSGIVSGPGSSPTLLRNRCVNNGAYGIHVVSGASPALSDDNILTGNAYGPLVRE